MRTEFNQWRVEIEHMLASSNTFLTKLSLATPLRFNDSDVINDDDDDDESKEKKDGQLRAFVQLSLS